VHRIALLVAGVLVSFAGIANHELWTPDEPRVAGIGREMWESRAWAVPRLSGEPFLEKPPLAWWAQAAVYELSGRTSAGLARLPSALFGLLTLAATYAMGRRFFSREAAVLGTLALLTTYGFFSASHWIIVDMALVAATTAALACFAHRRWLGVYAALALGFLAKGPIGVGLPVLGIGVHVVWTRQVRASLGLHLLWGPLPVAGAAALWLWRLQTEAGAEALHDFLVANQLGRFLPDAAGYSGGHERPFWYYLRQLPADLLPWTPITLLAALSARRALPALDARAAEGLRFVAATALPALLVLSLAGTKRGLYLLPLLPSLSLLAGWWMTHAPDDRLGRAWRGVLIGVGGVLSLVCVAIDPSYWLAAAAGAAAYLAAAFVLPLRSWLGATSLLCVGLALALTTAVPALDPAKNLRPLLEQVNERVPADATLHLFDPTETTRGFASFYTGRDPILVSDLDALASLPADSWVLVEGKRQRGDLARLAESPIPHRIVARHETSSGRVLALVKLGAGRP
jgi:4-amino-4-deoxy-L-arabinose transferase-like glycosyltransferase